MLLCGTAWRMRFKRVLCVAEKPTVAKAIANILNRQPASSLRTRSQYNPKYEFPFNFEGMMVTMVVTSVTGHLMETDFGDAYRKWNSCDPRKLLEISTPVERHVPSEKFPLRDTLKEEARKCDTLVCCLDGDREGENISFEVIDVCLSVNPRMNVRRARFSACIQPEIDRAFQRLLPPDKHLSDAVDARSEIDLRLGAAFTRFQTLSLGKRFEETQGQVLSWGPCQFATLGFIVDRDWKIESFVPEDFWSVALTFQRENMSVSFNWRRGKIFDHASCTALYEEMLDNGTATVMHVGETEKRRWRPLPLDTEELQIAASRKLQISSEETMQIAEDLYTKGIISYPRTETQKYKEGTDILGFIRKQVPSGQWGAFAARLADGDEFQWPRARAKGRRSASSHPPELNSSTT